MTVPAQFRTPAEKLRHIADENLKKGSKDWAELHRISGYIEGIEQGAGELRMQLEKANDLIRDRARARNRTSPKTIK